MPENKILTDKEIDAGLAKYKPLTDKEIHAAVMVEWLGLLESLWFAIGKDPDKRRLMIYAKDLGDVPFEILDRAISRVRKENSYQIVPTVAEIWKAVNKELANDNCNTCEDWIDLQYSRLIHGVTVGVSV